MLWTLWDPIVFTSMEYIKLNRLSQSLYTCRLNHFTWYTVDYIATVEGVRRLYWPKRSSRCVHTHSFFLDCSVLSPCKCNFRSSISYSLQDFSHLPPVPPSLPSLPFSHWWCRVLGSSCFRLSLRFIPKICISPIRLLCVQGYKAISLFQRYPWWCMDVQWL